MSVGIAPQFPAYFTLSGFYRLSVAKYHQMIDVGVLSKDDRVELLEGNLVAKMSQNRPHGIASTRTEEAIGKVRPAAWEMRVAKPITLTDSEPEPDVALVRRDWPTLRARHPEPPDVGLVVEVFDSRLSVDRVDKARIYARAGLPIYWIVNVVDRQVEVFTDPRPADAVPSYATRTDYKSGDSVPLVLDGRVVAQVAVDELLG